MSINNYPPEFLKVFWHDLSKEQQKELVLKHHQEYNDFLNGKLKGHLSETVRKLISINDILLSGARNNEFDIIKACIEHGANIHYDDDDAFRWAAYNGKLETVKYLVKHGANIHTNNDEALRMAISGGQTQIAEYLKSLP